MIVRHTPHSYGEVAHWSACEGGKKKKLVRMQTFNHFKLLLHSLHLVISGAAKIAIEIIQ